MFNVQCSTTLWFGVYLCIFLVFFLAVSILMVTFVAEITFSIINQKQTL